MNSLPRVCYMGAYDPAYPRNLILRRGLAAHHVDVVECRVPVRLNTRQRAAALREQFPPLADRCDVIVLAAFNQSLAWTAGALAHRHDKRLVLDAFTSLYDSAVHDRGSVPPRSLSALRYWLLDALALHLPRWWGDVTVLVDTAQHRDYFIQTFKARRERIHVIPVGASREWFATDVPSPDDSRVRVQFFGTYIPLHGIDTILQAAAQLRSQQAIQFELIGHGQTYAAMRTLADQLALDNVTFDDPIPLHDLRDRVAGAHISLGIFGTTDKAQRVVPNKVYQALALGKAVISAETPALRTLFSPGKHLLTTLPGDPGALAEAIRLLAGDAALRRQLGAAGHAHMTTHYTEEALGQRLLDVITS